MTDSKFPPTTSLFVALFLTLFSTIFNYTLSLMASPYIVGDLGGSNDIATYTVSFYALGNALGIPLGKTLLPRMGTARFLVIAMLLFTFFSWVCAIAPNYPFFNAARFLQGFVSGPFYALVFRLFFILCPEGKKDLFSSITASIFIIGPALGASWGGWIAYEWNWRWVFHFNVPLTLLLTCFLGMRLRGFDAKHPEPKLPFDGVGYATYFIALFSLGFSLIMGQELDWFRSQLIFTLTVIGTIGLLFCILWLLQHPYPILDLKLFKNPVLAFALFNLGVIFSAYFGMIILLSLWLKLWINYTPNWIAILIGTTAVAGAFPFFLIEERLKRMDSRIFLALAILILAISCFHTMLFNIEVNFGRIAFSRILAGIGLAIFLAPLFRLSLRSVPEENALHCISLFQVIRALASGLGVSFYATTWLRRQVFFHDRLGSRLTVSSPETQTFLTDAKQFHLEGDHAYAQLEDYLQRESSSLALDDCFYLMAWILIGLLFTFIVTFFFRKGSFFLSPQKEANPPSL
jgi:DHA2 family multidrug resistance protein